MINWIDVRDFAVVKHVSLSFDTGMTVLTGETGAGKSIIVDALAILLGDRTSGDIVRPGSDHAEIQADFDLSENPQAIAWLESHALTDKTGDCSLRRLVFRSQSSRGFINGRPAPIHYLQELGNLLVDIHSQHQHHRLLQRDHQREILDSYANTTDRVGKIAIVFERLKSGYRELEKLEESMKDTNEKQESLRIQIEELTMLNPDPEEIISLENSHKRLSHSLELAEETWKVIQSLDDIEDASASTLINKSLQRLVQLRKHDLRLSETCEQLENIVSQLSEIVSDLRKWQSEYDLNPIELEETEKRIALLHEAGRKYRIQPSGLQTLLIGFQHELVSTKAEQIRINELQKEIRKLEQEYDDLADQVRQARTIHSEILATNVTDNLVELGLTEAVFEIEFTPIEESRSRYGTESVMFMIRPNRDSQAGSLSKIASGGELSRISLAIQVAVTTNDATPSSIYDEVDVGIGGRIAEIVGSKLKVLANRKQILCITHLPQVAVQGSSHMQITKITGRETQICVEELSANQRLEEISRMLGGIEITPETRAHAADMLKRARN